MVNLDIEKLKQWKVELGGELAELEKQHQNLGSRIEQTRQQLEAVCRLLGVNGKQLDSAGHPALDSTREPSLRPASARRKSLYTPVHVYWPAILSSIIELGGSGAGDEVIDLVGRKLENILTPADREMIPSGVQVRWQNRIQWQRFNMVRQGLLRSDSPRGIWEITDEGRRWIARVADRVRGTQA